MDHPDLLQQCYQSQHILEMLAQRHQHNWRPQARVWWESYKCHCSTEGILEMQDWKKMPTSHLVYACALKTSPIYVNHPWQICLMKHLETCIFFAASPVATASISGSLNFSLTPKLNTLSWNLDRFFFLLLPSIEGINDWNSLYSKLLQTLSVSFFFYLHFHFNSQFSQPHDFCNFAWLKKKRR